jgi:phytoene desaturase
MKKKVVVIGAGFAGLSAATELASKGLDVMVVEKNSSPGGRAGKVETNGFNFDKGPSWYWMPEIFEDFFARYGNKSSDFYHLTRLDPSYRIYFSDSDVMDLPADFSDLKQVFENYQSGAGNNLEKFIEQADRKYKIAMEQFIHKPGLSATEYFSPLLLKYLFTLGLTGSFSAHARKFFTDKRLLQAISFPILFLGGTAESTPAMYSLMNYADMKLGTWYPEGGFYTVSKAFEQVALSTGVKIEYNFPIDKINVLDGKAIGVSSGKDFLKADYILAAADYHHVETHLLPITSRSYSYRYWSGRTLSPSALLYYIGVKRKLSGLLHHTLFFDTNFDQHAHSIYKQPGWPDEPSSYLSCTSLTDTSTAPEGMENLFALIPVAAGLTDSKLIRSKYYNIVIQRIKQLTGEDISGDVVVNMSYAQSDFSNEFNSFKGNAYGLANTLMQTAFLRPRVKSRQVKNLFYAGQLTVPGPGVPPAIISGQIAAGELIKSINR